MNHNEIMKVETYMRKLFGCDKITLEKTAKKDGSVDVHIEDEFIGIIYRDDEEGEVSYAFNMAILEMDLPKDS